MAHMEAEVRKLKQEVQQLESENGPNMLFTLPALFNDIYSSVHSAPGSASQTGGGKSACLPSECVPGVSRVV